MRFADIGPTLHRAGWAIVPIKPMTKKCVEPRWQHGFTDDQVAKFAANGYAGGSVGLLASRNPGVDIDVTDETCAAAIEAFALKRLGAAPVRVGSWPKRLLMYGTSTPFSKLKVYLTGPSGPKGLDGKDYAVEILGDGQQYLIYGQHTDGFEYRWPNGGGPNDCDVWDLTQVTREDAVSFLDDLAQCLPPGWSIREAASTALVNDDAFANYKPPLDGWDLDRVVAEVLPHLDADSGYEDWLKVGQALHHQGDGGMDWMATWDEWSQHSGKYSEGLCEAKWSSFTAGRSKGAVTLATLLLKTKDARKEAVVNAADTHRAAVTVVPDEKGLREIAQRIALDGSLDRVAKDMLASAIQAKFNELTGSRPTIAAVRGLLGMGKKRLSITSTNGPSWLQGWCYSTSLAKFFHLNSKEIITREAFDAAYCRNMPIDPDGNVPSAARTACDVWHIPTVYNLMYMPSAGDLFSVDGREYANLYRPDSAPGSVLDAAANVVLARHVELIIPDPEYRRLFMEWAAWIVRNPGLKVLWAVFLKGVEGDGKSVLGNMMAQAMGYENVGIISPETLAGSNFNDWAVGRCVNVIEELKMQGHNRHDVYNKIKPLITNPRIEVHGKGKASMTAVNTVNYIGFSNHIDALPLDDKDRRQFVLFTPWKDIAGLHERIKALGLTVEQYWDQLWDVVKNRPDAVRGFFDAVDLSAFNPHGRAPDSTFKSQVVMSNDADDAEAFAKYFIENGCLGVSSQVVSSACLTKALLQMDPPVVLHSTRVRKLLSGLGFSPSVRVIKWKGAAHRVWVTGGQVTGEVTGSNPDKIRGLLDATVPDPSLDFLN